MILTQRYDAIDAATVENHECTWDCPLQNTGRRTQKALTSLWSVEPCEKFVKGGLTCVSLKASHMTSGHREHVRDNHVAHRTAGSVGVHDLGNNEVRAREGRRYAVSTVTNWRLDSFRAERPPTFVDGSDVVRAMPFTRRGQELDLECATTQSFRSESKSSEWSRSGIQAKVRATADSIVGLDGIVRAACRTAGKFV